MSGLRRGILLCFAIGCAVRCSAVARDPGAQPSTAPTGSQGTCWRRILPTQAADSNSAFPLNLSLGKAKQRGRRPGCQPEARMTLRPKRPGCPFGETAFHRILHAAAKHTSYLTIPVGMLMIEGAESGFGGSIASAGGFEKLCPLPIRWLSGRG